MNIQELEEVLENAKNNNTEILIENYYKLKYKIKDFRLEQTSNSETLYLIVENTPIFNIKSEDTTTRQDTK